VARTWLSIRVDLIEGHGEQYWPRPGRIFAAARSHTFKQLADAVDDAFARRDRPTLAADSARHDWAGSRRRADRQPWWSVDVELVILRVFQCGRGRSCSPKPEDEQRSQG
jgi:hypothetical protein